MGGHLLWAGRPGGRHSERLVIEHDLSTLEDGWGSRYPRSAPALRADISCTE